MGTLRQAVVERSRNSVHRWGLGKSFLNEEAGGKGQGEMTTTESREAERNIGLNPPF
ncbi:hypothetical protein [Nostoc sp. LEGE 12450]|uniref:hypothetical protein n=1 Tax=Nostoc sp. LEGE 12450 TaxID=1828643 RepID=UPI001880DE04|nr:hypothetical protein [Nostoc sp. LEGE 12450]MBE8988691.1 hypothetical protein [Nostoc sp. LEGE 12450]